MKTQKKWVLIGALSVMGLGAGCASTKEAAHAYVPEKRDGQVVGIQGNNIAVNDANKPSEPAAWLHVTPDTKIERNGKRVELSEITEGTPVRVSFKTAAGPEEASEIKVLTGSEAQKVQKELKGAPTQPATPPPPENP
jgi:hypothetical protein